MAQDGQQALDIAAKVKPDLILLDVRMLQMNSFADCMTNLPLLLQERDSFGPAVSPARRVRSPPRILGLLPSNYLLSPVSCFLFPVSCFLFPVSCFLKTKKRRERSRQPFTALILAAPQGFEPRLPDPESGVLPLYEGAINLCQETSCLGDRTSSARSRRRIHVACPSTSINSNNPGPNPTPHSDSRVG